MVFDLDFKSISLIDLVSYEKTREYLKAAKEWFERNDTVKTCIKLSLSFDSLIQEYENKAGDPYGISPFAPGGDLRFWGGDYTDEETGQLASNVGDAFRSIQKELRILCLGIDYRKFVMFSSFIPEFSSVPEESDDTYSTTAEDVVISKEEFSFCVDFIIESALRLQDFKFVPITGRIKGALAFL